MMKVINKLSGLCGKYMALLTILMAGFALLFPQGLTQLASVGINTEAVFGSHFSKLSLVNILLGIIMFGMGMTLKIDDFKLILKRPVDVLIGVCSQFVIMSTLAFLLAKLFNLNADFAIGLIILGCVPGGTASNVMTFLAKGDVALSVTITMCTTLLATIFTPSLTYLFGREWVQVDFLNMFLSVTLVVALPVVLGIVVHTLLKEKADKIKPLLVMVSTLAIIFVVGLCVAPNAAQFLQMNVLVVILAVTLHHILGLALGYFIARIAKFDDAKCRALSLEVGLQNSGLSVGLAGQFAAVYPLATLPCAIATVVHQIVGAIVANMFASRPLKEEVEEVCESELAYSKS